MSAREIIITFHGVGDPHAGVDADERPYWVGADRYAEILDLIDRHPNGADAVFTFDDGNTTDLAAAEALHARGRSGKFYVLTARIGQPHYLGDRDLHHLLGLGMEVGLHGRDHVNWSEISDARLEAETVEARERLAAAIGRPVTSVAIPFGAYRAHVIRRLRAAGFERIYTCDGGWARAGQRVRDRTSIRADTSLDDVRAILDSPGSLAQRARRWARTRIKRHVL